MYYLFFNFAPKKTENMQNFTINCKGELIDLSMPRVMGILNITPDSFFDGGKYTSESAIIERTRKIINEGADIIDIGAYSSRPGAADVPENEEIKRLDNALKIIRKNFPDVCISVDTFRSSVADFVVKNYAVDMINDIFAGSGSPDMFSTISRLNVSYVMMHIQGTPQTMQNNPQYDDIIGDILYYFSEKIKQATLHGINDIILDPGFGFGKAIDHNYQLLNRLNELQIAGYPLLVGISRKSMIYRYLDVTPEDVLPGTIALNTVALLKGASILRVHDVAEAVQTIKIIDKLTKKEA